MRNHGILKFFAIALCALCLLGAVASGGGLLLMAGLYLNPGESPADQQERHLTAQMENYGAEIVSRYVAGLQKDADEEFLAHYYYHINDIYGDWDMNYEIRDAKGKLLQKQEDVEGTTVEKTFQIAKGRATYPKILKGPLTAEVGAESDEILALWGEETPKDGFFDMMHVIQYYYATQLENGDQILGIRVEDQEYIYKIRRVPVEEPYTVTLRLNDRSGELYREQKATDILQFIWERQTLCAGVLGGSLLLFAVLAVYLCMAAGHKPGREEIRPGGLNCVPLELYLAAFIGVTAVYIFGAVEGFWYLLDMSNAVMFAYYGYGGYLCCLLFVGFCFACAAQFKAPNFYWWHHSVTGLCWRVAVWCWHFFWKCLGWGYRILWSVALTVLAWGWKQVRKLWSLVCKAGRLLLGWLKRMYGLLPLSWQWLLGGCIVGGCTFPGLLTDNSFLLLVSFVVAMAVVIYGANAFGTLLEATKRMRGGDLEIKVDDKLMVGGFKDFAGELNGLSDVVLVAAQKQMRSERMRTELITNVSHDIKTPLTSIINYVDLLQKPHTPEEEQVYLEVLSRQSGRMKRLIDDLIELSKASTGNITVNAEKMDAVEAVNQALGEFSDKLTAAKLIPVFRAPQEPVYIHADGRLAWRAMSNLLSNAVKYAQPGTRLYVDMVAVDGRVCVSFKNISRDPLNVSADELMERFVRGEASRNQEGSGLGLNIAQSMMELQHGALELLVDGDLFKATLVFPQEAE